MVMEGHGISSPQIRCEKKLLRAVWDGDGWWYLGLGTF